MNKNVLLGAGAVVIAAVVAWSQGLLGGGGMSEDVINERLKARQAAFIASSGKDGKVDDLTLIRSANVKGTTIRHKVFLQTEEGSEVADTQLEETRAVLTKHMCADEDAAELLAGGATIRFDVDTRHSQEVGTIELKKGACAS